MFLFSPFISSYIVYDKILSYSIQKKGASNMIKWEFRQKAVYRLDIGKLPRPEGQGFAVCYSIYIKNAIRKSSYSQTAYFSRVGYLGYPTF